MANLSVCREKAAHQLFDAFCVWFVLWGFFDNSAAGEEQEEQGMSAVAAPSLPANRERGSGAAPGRVRSSPHVRHQKEGGNQGSGKWILSSGTGPLRTETLLHHPPESPGQLGSTLPALCPINQPGNRRLENNTCSKAPAFAAKSVG